MKMRMFRGAIAEVSTASKVRIKYGWQSIDHHSETEGIPHSTRFDRIKSLIFGLK
jgi:hypothetical protein